MLAVTQFHVPRGLWNAPGMANRVVKKADQADAVPTLGEVEDSQRASHVEALEVISDLLMSVGES
jgi:hypothetical protein